MGEAVASIVERVLAGSPEVADAAAVESPGVRATLDARLAELEAEFKTARTAAVAHLLRDGAPEPDWAGACERAAVFMGSVARSTRAAALIIEGFVHQYGWEGLLHGLRLYRRLLEEQRERVYPAQPGQRHALFFVQTRDFNLRPPLPMPIPVWNVPVVTASGRGVGLYDIQLLDKQLRKFPELDEVYRARAALPASGRTAWDDAGRAALAESDLLRVAMRNDIERAGVDVPPELDASFTRLETRVRTYLEQAGEWFGAVPAPEAGTPEPPVPDEPKQGAEKSERAPSPSSPPPSPPPGAVRSRSEALILLAATIEFFARTDPHSPVGYRLRTARRWMTQPVADVLAQLLSAGEPLSAALKGLGVEAPAGGTADDASSPTDGADGQGASVAQENGDGVSPGRAAEQPAISGRDHAVKVIEAVADYLRACEPHSMAKFPLAFALKLAKMSIEAIIEQAIVDENARDMLLRELGVPFLNKSSAVKK